MSEENQEVKQSVIEEVRKIRDDIFAARDELRAENDRKERLVAESLLAGTGGGAVVKEKKPMSPAEYTKYIEQHGRAPPNEN